MMLLASLLGAQLLVAPVAAPVAASAAPPFDPLAELERQQQALFAAAAPSVVLIRSASGIGSGFFVSSSGLLLTNRHVVGKSKRVDIILNDGRRSTGVVVQVAKDDVDLALVQAEIRDVRPLPLADLRTLRVGAWAAAVGHGEGAIWTFNTGMISNIYPVGSLPVLQTQIPLNPGNSGGPVLDRSGRVLGVVTAGIEDAQNLNFAIRIDMAAQVLPQLRTHCKCLTIHAPVDVPVFLDGALAGRGPTVVVVVEAGAHEAFAVVKGKRRAAKAQFPRERVLDLRR